MNVKVGYMLGMVFLKDPEQTRVNVVIKGMYYDKVWVMYEQSGKDEILDTADVGFNNPTPGTVPEHSFIAQDASGQWLFWDHEKGFWYECPDPTDMQSTPQEESLSNGESTAGQTLH